MCVCTCVFVYWECASNRIDRLDWAHVIYWFALEICIQPHEIYISVRRCTASLYANQTANKVYIKYQPLRSVWMWSMLNTPQNRTYTRTEYDRSIDLSPIVQSFRLQIYIFINVYISLLFSRWVSVCMCVITFILVSLSHGRSAR